MKKLSRRNFLVAGTGALGFAGVALKSQSPYYGEVISPTEFFSLPQIKEYGQTNSYPTNYIPRQLRTPNTDGSCVHLATAICLISIGQYEIAHDWLNSYSRGEYSSRHISRMEQKGLLFAVETNGNPEFLDFWAGNTQQVAKRVMGVSYTTRHVMNLLDIDPANQQYARAYLLNNQRRSGVRNWDSPFAWEVERNEFIRGWDGRGGWAFCVLGTNQQGIIPPAPPYPYV